MSHSRLIGVTATFFTIVGVANSAPVPAGAEWITVRGRVVWPKKVAVPENVPINFQNVPDGEYAARGGPLFEDKVLVDAKNRGLKNVVVWLRPDGPALRPPFPGDKVHPQLKAPKPSTHLVTSEFCRYDRRTLAIRDGDRVEFFNNQPVAENIKYDDDETQSNRLLKPDQRWTSDRLTSRLGEFRSTIHPWMKGYVRTFDHPYFAVTDADGRFEIPKAPTGVWRIMYWHELGFHKGAAGRTGFPIDVKDEGRGVKTLPAVEYEQPSK